MHPHKNRKCAIHVNLKIFSRILVQNIFWRELFLSFPHSLLFYSFSFTRGECGFIQQLMVAINHFIDEMQLPSIAKAFKSPK